MLAVLVDNLFSWHTLTAGEGSAHKSDVNMRLTNDQDAEADTDQKYTSASSARSKYFQSIFIIFMSEEYKFRIPVLGLVILLI